MPNLNVGLITTVLLTAFLCITPTYAARDAEFYDENQTFFGQDDNDTTTQLNLNSYDNGCAYHPTSKVAYSCNGLCNRSEYTTKINVPPNGSHFSDGTATYVCTTDGWLECGVQSDNVTLTNEFNFLLYNGDETYDATGYKEFTVNPYGSVMDANEFCLSPYYHLNQATQSGVWYTTAEAERGFLKQWTDSDGNLISSYSYDGCAAGYYLEYLGSTGTQRGYICSACPSVANGQSNTNTWHTNTTCTVQCNTGYGYQASTDTCEVGATNEYHAYNYGGEEYDYRECPDGALCDGEYIYCPAGSYPYYSYENFFEPYCRDCPGKWGMVSTLYTKTLTTCSGVANLGNPEYEWGKGYSSTTDCLYTDYSSTDDTPCVEFMGDDTTGSYEYRYSDGDWYDCAYEE